MDILDEVGKHIPKDENLIETECISNTSEYVKNDHIKGVEIDSSQNVTHPIEDMTVEELEQHLGQKTESKMSVKEVIDIMNDPNINMGLPSFNRRTPKIPAKKRKIRKKMAKNSRKINRSKK